MLDARPWTMIDLQCLQDERGRLAFIESGAQIPFDIRRVFYLYGVPSGMSRAGHALKSCEQFLIAVSGSFEVLAFDGNEQERFRLDKPEQGLHLSRWVWRELVQFSSDAVCLVLASHAYDETDYCRDYEEYLRLRRMRGKDVAGSVLALSARREGP